MRILNLSTLTDKLCEKLYDCIENDLLGSLQRTRHSIAPYNSNGVEKASELTVSRDTTTSNSEFDLATNGMDISYIK
ncbi:unnamed protein product [Prunus armeniaca]